MNTLYFKEGTSDKIYQVSVDACAGGYDVNFAYGRRGSTLTAGKKNSTPLPKDAADKLAEKLLREKMAKGYTPGENGTAYVNTDKEERFTGILPMLLNSIEEHEVEKYIQDPNWVLQAKEDGRHIEIRKQDGNVDGINRKGLIVALPQKWISEIKKIPGDFILDGEAVGSQYRAFDTINAHPLRKRLFDLADLTDHCDNNIIVTVASYLGEGVKRYAADLMKSEGKEGLVFKDLNALYTPGRPNSGGPALKFKFTATANVRVVGINTQRSAQIALQGDIPCGNVTIPANKDIPNVGDLIEVRYLYAMPGSSALYQPFYARLRDDMVVADTVSSLKYKREEE